MPQMSFGLDDKIVLITGAGQGIGRTYAKAFAAEGAVAVIAELDGEKGERVAKEIEDAGGRALAVRTDVADEASVTGAVGAALEAFGQIDVLINNAAIFASLGRQTFDEIPLEEWEQVMRVNVTGTFLCAKAVAGPMREAGRGRIINISSDTVPMGLSMFTHYVTSKAAVIGLTRCMARELGEHGINVNAVCPGLTDTEVENPGRTDAVREAVLDQQCLKRLEAPDDLVGMLLFLASSASDFVTGQALYVNGGCVHSAV